jgi:hypothetical protein
VLNISRTRLHAYFIKECRKNDLHNVAMGEPIEPVAEPQRKW